LAVVPGPSLLLRPAGADSNTHTLPRNFGDAESARSPSVGEGFTEVPDLVAFPSRQSLALAEDDPMTASAQATRRPARGPAALVALAFVIGLSVAMAAVARADDVEWKGRISKSLSDVEMGIAVLDGKPPMPGSLFERAAALDARIAALESAAGLAPGKVSGKDALFALTGGAASLNTRWQRVAATTSSRRRGPSGG
jgi:hypothetical protein